MVAAAFPVEVAYGPAALSKRGAGATLREIASRQREPPRNSYTATVRFLPGWLTVLSTWRSRRAEPRLLDSPAERGDVPLVSRSASPMRPYLSKRVVGIDRSVVLRPLVVALALPLLAAWQASSVAVTPSGRGEPARTRLQGEGEARNQRPGPLSASQIWPVDVPRVSARPLVMPEPGLYGEISAAPRTDVGPLMAPAMGAGTWTGKPFATVVSELSPAVLYSSELARDDLLQPDQRMGTRRPHSRRGSHGRGRRGRWQWRSRRWGVAVRAVDPRLVRRRGGLDVRRAVADRARTPGDLDRPRRRRAAHPVRWPGRAIGRHAALRLLQGAPGREEVVGAARLAPRTSASTPRDGHPRFRRRSSPRARWWIEVLAAIPDPLPRDVPRGPPERRADHQERIRVHRHCRRVGHRRAYVRPALAHPGPGAHRRTQHVPDALLGAGDRPVRHDLRMAPTWA